MRLLRTTGHRWHRPLAWLAWCGLLFGLAGQAIPATAEPTPYLLDFRLPSLGNETRPGVRPGHFGAHVDLRQFEGQAVILLFFEPECRWCAKQVKTLVAVKEDFPDLQVVVIGVHGSSVDLRRFIRRHQVTFPALQATDYLLAALGGIPATPFLLLADRMGRINAARRGYTDHEALTQLLRDLP